MTQRTNFDKELDRLKLTLVEMAELVSANIKEGLSSFLKMDTEIAEANIKKDKLVNEYEQTIEKDCLRIIQREQPVAKDLRFITSVLKMVTDLERIGDHAADIAKMTIFMEKTHSSFFVNDIEEMTTVCQKMIKQAIEAFISTDKEIASAVIETDDIVDDLFESTKAKVAEAIRNKKVDADFALYLMMVAKYLERIGDHAVNIAEWVIYSITGERL
ncbi:MAG: phosphate signaling complex protein PhoU [Candidatus Izemoplasmatales bacterium]|jgi:phosphate transport system protein|nr:phosphate signaling complex protein PhoU [Candidatus Izemoplasmatales bacterium]